MTIPIDEVISQESNMYRNFLNKIFIKIFGERIIYPCIFEDYRSDVQAWGKINNIFCICSGGENALNYLLYNPQRVYVSEIHFPHYALAKLKMAAFEHLPTYEDVLSFVARADSIKNAELYQKYIFKNLAPEIQQYWGKDPRNDRIKLFCTGLYNQGPVKKFVKFLKLLCGGEKQGNKLISLLEQAQSKDSIEKFIEDFSPKGIKREWFNFLLKVPFLWMLLGIPYRQFEYIKNEIQSNNENFIDYEQRQLLRILHSFLFKDNYYMSLILFGKYSESQDRLPGFLQKENYQTIKNNLHKIDLRFIEAQKYLNLLPENAVDNFTFLDAKDWMTERQLETLWGEIGRTASQDATVVFRSASKLSPLCGLKLEEKLESGWQSMAEMAEKIYAEDRAPFYGNMHIMKRKAA